MDINDLTTELTIKKKNWPNHRIAWEYEIFNILDEIFTCKCKYMTKYTNTCMHVSAICIKFNFHKAKVSHIKVDYQTQIFHGNSHQLLLLQTASSAYLLINTLNMFSSTKQNFKQSVASKAKHIQKKKINSLQIKPSSENFATTLIKIVKKNGCSS